MSAGRYRYYPLPRISSMIIKTCTMRIYTQTFLTTSHQEEIIQAVNVLTGTKQNKLVMLEPVAYLQLQITGSCVYTNRNASNCYVDLIQVVSTLDLIGLCFLNCVCLAVDSFTSNAWKLSVTSLYGS